METIFVDRMGPDSLDIDIQLVDTNDMVIATTVIKAGEPHTVLHIPGLKAGNYKLKGQHKMGSWSRRVIVQTPAPEPVA